MLDTLKKPREFKELMSRGKRVETPYFTLLISPAAHEKPRYGLTVSKKMGNAVARNRIKRRYRALTICIPESEFPQIDFVFLARRRALDADFAEMKKAFMAAIRKGLA